MIMKEMKHQNVVQFKHIFENLKFLMIEMEYIPGGQLKRLFKREKILDDNEAAEVMKSLLEGVAYIHERNIIHRDLKPENVLVARDSSKCTDVKIVDFGLSAVFSFREDKKPNGKAGTLIYMAPEQVSSNSYTKKIDMWSCGIMMY